MQVILLQDVEHVGSRGALVEVKPGHARNYLVPKKLAHVASAKNTRELKHLKWIAAYAQKKAQAATRALKLRLASTRLEIARKVGEQDKLFGSVTAQDVHAALQAKGIVEVKRQMLELREPIKALGEYEVVVRLSTDAKATLKVAVVAE